MKSASAYYLLLFYITAMCKPVLPVAKDMLAHIFWEAQHISTVHHQNGKDHLHHELIDTSNKNKTEPASPLKISEPVSVHILLQNTFDFTLLVIVEKEYSDRSYVLLNPIVEMNIPPPKV